ncbi:HNH endonuclease [Pantoea sp. Acro-807]|uniref:HNH endonuclease n=1 Tax=Pantoea sp. Acro-807 TaxID=2608356 RepID=UPI001FFCC746|nr:HNH endonuclease [Pantoea sp. Acro-807]
MKYYWVTQNLKSQKKELKDSILTARPAKTEKHHRKNLKNVESGDVVFLCCKGIINHIAIARKNSEESSDESGKKWQVQIKVFSLSKPINIEKNKSYLLEHKSEKYYPLNADGIPNQGYCFNLEPLIAYYLLSRAGVYVDKSNVIELNVGSGVRVNDLKVLLNELNHDDIKSIIDDFKHINFESFKYANSVEYDLLYNGTTYPPKVIFGFSAKKIINRPLFSDEFSGGKGSPCFDILEKNGFKIIFKDTNAEKIESSTKNDIEKIVSDVTLPETSKEQLIEARLGQGKFRQQLIRMYSKCIITGIDVEQLLRASHIKPWSKSNNTERLDCYNGLLLSANMDTLFDKLLITFEDNGQIILSRKLKNTETMTSLGLDQNLQITLDPKSAEYMCWHRKAFFEKEAS